MRESGSGHDRRRGEVGGHRIVGKVSRPLRVDRVVELAGKATADITVAPRGRLSLTGTCAADLRVEADGIAEIGGTVLGSVHNDGGRVWLYGTVKGDLRALAGSTVVDEDAVVEGEIVGSVRRS